MTCAVRYELTFMPGLSSAVSLPNEEQGRDAPGRFLASKGDGLDTNETPCYFCFLWYRLNRISII